MLLEKIEFEFDPGRERFDGAEPELDFGEGSTAVEEEFESEEAERVSIGESLAFWILNW